MTVVEIRSTAGNTIESLAGTEKGTGSNGNAHGRATRAVKGNETLGTAKEIEVTVDGIEIVNGSESVSGTEVGATTRMVTIATAQERGMLPGPPPPHRVRVIFMTA